ncbi:MAG: HAMP domain-containing protein [Bacteroidetes bacterium]|nr:HAMP domain-containing protein [Bacteroidota bacterium]
MPPRKTHENSPRSLSATLALVFVGFCCLVLVILGAVQLYTNIRLVQESIADRQQLIGRKAAETVQRFVDDKLHTLRTALWITDAQTMGIGDQEALLQSLSGLENSFKRLFIFDPNDREIVTVSRRSQAIEERRACRYCPDALRAVRSAQHYTSSVYIDSTTNEPAILIGVPITDAYGVHQGSLIAEVNLKFMWEVVERIPSDDQGVAYVVDNTGALIAFGDPARVLRGDNVRYIELVEDFVSGRIQSGGLRARLYRGISGDWVIGAGTPLESLDWAVIVEIPVLEASQGIIQRTIISIVVFLILAGFAAFLGVRLARRLSEPIVRLMDTAGRIAGGERAIRADITGTREIVALGEAFNSMTSQLDATMSSLEQQIEEVKEKESALRKSLSEKEALLREIHHRVKNNLQVISSLLHMQSAQSDDPRVRSVLAESEHRLRTMALVHEALYRTDNFAGIDVGAHLRRTLEELMRSYARTDLAARVEVEKVDLPIDTAIPCGLIVNELVTNTLKYAFPEKRKGTITLKLSREVDGSVELIVQDDGIGFPAGVDFRTLKSMGMTIVTSLVDQLSGTITMDNALGTTFRIRFPS